MRSRRSDARRAFIAALALIAAGCRNEPGAPPPGEQGAEPARSTPDPWINARERGVDFRAVGQEPGWYVEVDHAGSIRLVWDYLQREATLPARAPEAANRETRYTSSTDAHRLTIVAAERPCQDGMSGQPFPLTVTLRIDGRELQGCGRALGAENTRWRVEGNRVGPIRPGMSRPELASALGRSVPAIRATDSAGCELTPVPDAPGVLVMLIDDHVARIDITAAGIAAAGVEVGMREERLREAYGPGATISPHKYTDGTYVTVAPDAAHRLVFETEGGWVTRYRVGRLPEVEWVEGCG